MREGYQMTELGEIPVDWEVLKFIDVMVLQRGFDLPTGKRTHGEVPLIASNGIIDFHNEFKVNGPLIVTGRSGTLGKVYFEERNSWPLNTTLYVKDFKGNDPKFLYYFLLSQDIKQYGTGTGVPTLNRNVVHLRKITIPSSVIEQQKIATILSTVDEKIEVIDAQITQTKELKKGLMQKLLTRGIGHTKFKNSVLGEIPESWEVKRFKDISTLISGLHLGPEEYNREELGIPYFTGPSDYSNSISNVSKWTNKGNSIALAGDTLITVKGSGAGGVFYLNLAQVFISRQVMAVRANSKTSNLFIFQYLTQKGFYFQELAKGNMIPGLSRKDILLTEIPVPPLSEQKQISTIFSTIDEKINILQTKKESYQELKKGLMQQLLTGKVRVVQPELATA